MTQRGFSTRIVNGSMSVGMIRYQLKAYHRHTASRAPKHGKEHVYVITVAINTVFDRAMTKAVVKCPEFEHSVHEIGVQRREFVAIGSAEAKSKCCVW